MSESFVKSLKWFLTMGLIIIGLGALYAMNEHGIRPAMIAVLSFGAAFVFSGSWRDTEKPVLLAALGAMLVTAFAAQYVELFFAAFLNMSLPVQDYFVLWAGLVFVLGVPFMAVMFHKHD